MAARDSEATESNDPPDGDKLSKAQPSKAQPSKAQPSKDKPLPPAAKRKKPTADRVERGGSGAGGRYTAPVPAAKKGPSPRWVPVLMFAFWGVGLGLILLNYMGVLPGSADGGNGWYLVGGLGLILMGIITATQYR